MNSAKLSTRLRPVIRVFVSSTFSDMKHERNALHADVFPKLEQLCQKSGFQFQAIDLRWGVSTEAGLDHRTMRICFDELRRAQEISPKPNFLILLGDRYGWRPLPEEISMEEFHTLEHAAAQIPDSAGKSAVAVLREWYREDTNAVPPVYLLQSRRQDLGDGQDYTDDAVWNQIQAILWKIINRAMPPEQLQQRFDGVASDGLTPAIVRFQTSATEQEIWHGALRVPDAPEHVLAFFRKIENISAFSDPKLIKGFVDVDPFGSIEVALKDEQDRLKEELGKRLGSANIFRNETPVRLEEAQDNQGGRTFDVTTDHHDQLCTNVLIRLSEIIQGQLEEYWRNTTQASTDRAARELEIEQREYERFAKERGGEESFVGRQVELQSILNYVGSDSRWPLLIHGASGCGKTALVARASQEVAKTRNRIERFIGVAPRSSDLRSLLSSLCQELRQWNPRPDALPTEIKELRDEFSLHLQAATPEQPLILFLDALDQLADADNGRLLNWLPPGSLPAHVKLVVSCLSDRDTGDPAGQPYAELKRRQIPAVNFINLDVLSEAEARLLLFNRWLPRAGRKVNDDQRARVEQRLTSPACRQPIFLKLLFEEVQLWHSYDPATVLGESVSVLLRQLFDRLSLETNHGPLLVERVLGYLAASRHGLAENEVLEILFADPEYRAKLNEATEETRHELPPNAKRIPIALWSRLRFDLAPYLTERAAPGANVLTFYHRQVAEWIHEIYLKHLQIDWNPHERLADFFESKADPDRNLNWKLNPRFLGELPFHVAHAGRKMKLQELFSQLAFLSSRVATNQIYEQIEDYNLASPLSEVLEPWRNFLKKHAQRLKLHPTMLLPLINHEGFHEAKVQVTNIPSSQPWLYTSIETMPKANVTSSEGVHVRVIGNIEFQWGRLSAISPHKSLAFCVERLGVISVFDLNRMQQIDADLHIRRDRPLAIACSDAADCIAVFYESGNAELYQCKFYQNNLPVSLEMISEFEFYLPESEDPIVVWHKNFFWYQSTYNTISSVSHQLPRVVEKIIVNIQQGELAALVFIKNMPIIALRQGGDTVILTSSTLFFHQQGVHVATMCVCGENRIAVVFTDGYLKLFEIADNITLKEKMNIGMVRGAIGWDGSRLLWLSDTGKFNAWSPGDDTPTNVQNNQEIFPLHLHIVPNNWLLLPDNSILLDTTHSIITFRILGGGIEIDSRLEEIFGGPVWRTVCKRGKDQWLIEKNPLREVLLGKEISGRLYCALDGMGWFYALSGYGPGLAIELSSMRTKTLQKCPYGLNVAVGEDEGGCWFTDRAGDIYYIDALGYSHCIVKIELDDVHGAILENCGDYLVWIGYSSKFFPDSGAEPARTLIFYRKHIANIPILERVGAQYKHPREGLCIAFCHDRVAKKLVTLWVIEKEGIENYKLRVGSVEEFAQWKFQELNVLGLGQIKFVQANLSADSRFLGVLNMAGEISCVSITDGKVITSLSGSYPFTALVDGCEGSEFWLVENHSIIYKCKLFEKKNEYRYH